MAENDKIIVELIRIKRLAEVILIIFLTWFFLWVMTNIVVT